MVEKLPVLLSGFPDRKARLVDIPNVEDGCGSTVCDKSLDTVGQINGAIPKIKSVTSDTPSPNTGRKTGSFVEVQRRLEKEILVIECRHHVADLYQKAAYQSAFGDTTAPANGDFKDFRKKYRKLNRNTSRLNPTENDPRMIEALQRMKEACEEALRDPNVRSDRKEYALLCLQMNGFPHPGLINSRLNLRTYIC